MRTSVSSLLLSRSSVLLWSNFSFLEKKNARSDDEDRLLLSMSMLPIVPRYFRCPSSRCCSRPSTVAAWTRNCARQSPSCPNVLTLTCRSAEVLSLSSSSVFVSFLMLPFLPFSLFLIQPLVFLLAWNAHERCRILVLLFFWTSDSFRHEEWFQRFDFFLQWHRAEMLAREKLLFRLGFQFLRSKSTSHVALALISFAETDSTRKSRFESSRNWCVSRYIVFVRLTPYDFCCSSSSDPLWR